MRYPIALMDRLTARVLVFLTVRVAVNSFRRAFENPLRAVLTVLVVGFLLCSWGGALVGALLEPVRPPRAPQLMLDPETVLMRSMAIVLGLHLIYIVLGIMPAFLRGQFSYFVEGDVNFLFPTPVRALSLFRGLLLVRGAIGTLFLMLFLFFYLLLSGGRSIRQLAMVAEPQASGWALLVYPPLFMLMSLALLWLGVAVRLMEERRPRILWWFWAGVLSWAFVGVGLVAGRVWFLMWQDEMAFAAALQASMDWWFAYVWLLPARALSDAALIIYQGWTPAMGLGLLFWLGVLLWADGQIARDAGRLYELASQMAQRGARFRAARGDPMQMMYQSALERMSGRNRPVRTLRWLERWTPRGVWALLWRDLLLSWRLQGWGLVFMLLLLVAIPAIPLGIVRYIPIKEQVVIAKSIYVMIQYLIVVMAALGSYYGIVDLLRRVDFQKPFPFSSREVVLVESLPTAILFLIVQALVALVATFFFPQAWGFWLGIGLVVASFAPVLQMAIWMMALLNPDPNDYTQRLVLGLLMFPVIVLVGLPGGLLLVIGLVLKLSPLLIALLVMAANLSVGAILVAINARLYEQFSPVD
ncbi:MAG: putative ABC exporter domain-containing protein [Armatimonadota bacterium]